MPPLGSRQAHREASERDNRARRFLLRLSLINWRIAVVAWSVSAYLGITSPASIIVYSVLFVIGLWSPSSVALLTYLLEKFAHRPSELHYARAGATMRMSTVSTRRRPTARPTAVAVSAESAKAEAVNSEAKPPTKLNLLST